MNESARNGVPAFTIDHVIKTIRLLVTIVLYIEHNYSYHHMAHQLIYKRLIVIKQTLLTSLTCIFVPSDSVNPTLTVGNYSNHVVYSGETFTNNITANDNYALGSVQVAPNSQIAGTVSNNNQTVSLQAPNVSTSSDKTITLVATDTSGNTTNQSFNVTVKPLKINTV